MRWEIVASTYYDPLAAGFGQCKELDESSKYYDALAYDNCYHYLHW